jgi:hypothetical protein
VRRRDIFKQESQTRDVINFSNNKRVNSGTASVVNGQSSWMQHGDVLCFLRDTNWIDICYVEESRPPLWSGGKCPWLQVQRSGFDSRRYQIFWEAVGLERGPLSFVTTIEELLERKSSGSGLEIREYGRRYPLLWPRGFLYPQKLTLTSPTSGRRSVGIVRSRTEATEFSLVFIVQWNIHKFNWTLPDGRTRNQLWYVFMWLWQV